MEGGGAGIWDATSQLSCHVPRDDTRMVPSLPAEPLPFAASSRLISSGSDCRCFLLVNVAHTQDDVYASVGPPLTLEPLPEHTDQV